MITLTRSLFKVVRKGKHIQVDEAPFLIARPHDLVRAVKDTRSIAFVNYATCEWLMAFGEDVATAATDPYFSQFDVYVVSSAHNVERGFVTNIVPHSRGSSFKAGVAELNVGQYHGYLAMNIGAFDSYALIDKYDAGLPRFQGQTQNEDLLKLKSNMKDLRLIKALDCFYVFKGRAYRCVDNVKLSHVSATSTKSTGWFHGHSNQPTGFYWSGLCFAVVESGTINSLSGVTTTEAKLVGSSFASAYPGNNTAAEDYLVYYRWYGSANIYRIAIGCPGKYVHNINPVKLPLLSGVTPIRSWSCEPQDWTIDLSAMFSRIIASWAIDGNKGEDIDFGLYGSAEQAYAAFPELGNVPLFDNIPYTCNLAGIPALLFMMGVSVSPKFGSQDEFRAVFCDNPAYSEMIKTMAAGLSAETRLLTYVNALGRAD